METNKIRRPILTRRILDALIDCYGNCEAGGFAELTDGAETEAEENKLIKNLEDSGQFLRDYRTWLDAKSEVRK